MQYVNVMIKKDNGEVVFERNNVEAPDSWSHHAIEIAASKFFTKNETSIYQMVDRVVRAICIKQSWVYEVIPTFEEDLREILLGQRASFNSPVWFNLGVNERSALSACFILGLEDTMESILDTNRIAGEIFRYGGGRGINWSKLRGKNELLSNGGKASGIISFLSGFDAFAGIIKSGGKTRRAASMDITNDNHPDIMEFVRFKPKEERKLKDLIDTGNWGSPYDMESEAANTVKGQNANLAVRCSDKFMHAVLKDEDWALISSHTKEVVNIIKAKDLWNEIVNCAWTCGDPGLQFDDIINKYNPLPNRGRINSSNPCSEFMFFDDSACNLASLNLLKYLKDDNYTIDYEKMEHDVRVMITAQDAICSISPYPTKAITDNSALYRPLGLGYAGLGSLFMRRGVGYGSNHARELAKKITKFITVTAWDQSHVLYEHLGANLNDTDQKEMSEYLKKYYELDIEGVRNAQVTLLAPCGTIGFIMDCDTTGIEPFMGLKVTKKLIGGSTMSIVAKAVEDGLRVLKYDPEEGRKYLEKTGTLKGFVRDQDLAVFATALGDNVLTPEDHINMVAAVQPFLSGSISKTVNTPNNYTKEDISNVFMEAWRQGVKCITIYRDGSKNYQPVSSGAPGDKKVTKGKRKMPSTRQSITHKIDLAADGIEAYVTMGFYEDGTPGEVFITISNGGPTLQGLTNVLGIMISMMLQSGIPVENVIEKMKHQNFSPNGWTTNEDIPMCTSIVDYIAVWMEQTLKLNGHERKEIVYGRTCPTCKSDKLQKSGTCYSCLNCGSTTGCG